MTDDLPEIPGYRVESPLNSGGMATVYLATQDSLQRRVAIKVMHSWLGEADKTFVKRFVDEARITANLQHDRILTVIDFGEVDGKPFIVMEYLPGGSLQERMKSSRMSANDLTRIMMEVCIGLGWAHQNGFVHRDIKPHNILFNQAGQAVVSDFGIVKALSQSDERLTGSLAIGTPPYMSPEQIRGVAEIDGRSDLYSVGVIMYEILEGKLPFDGPTDQSVLLAHVTEPAPKLSHREHPLAAIVDNLLCKNPEDRFDTAEDLVVALGKSLDAADRPVEGRVPVDATTVATPQPQAPPIPEGAGDSHDRLDWGRVLKSVASATASAVVSLAIKLAGLKGTARTVMLAGISVAVIAVTVLVISGDGSGAVLKDCESCPEMVVLPAGRFQMGSDEDEEGREEYEAPRHQVEVPAIAMGRFEVTVGQFRAFVDAAGYATSNERQNANTCSVTKDLITFKSYSFYTNPKYHWRLPGFSQSAEDPVTCVSWYDAIAYIKWLSGESGHLYRLPSEAEWEYAARAGSEDPKPWSADESQCIHANGLDGTARRQASKDAKLAAIDCDDGAIYTSRVGTYHRNDFGLQDMLGNVGEWCSDVWHDRYIAAPDNASPWDYGANVNNRVIRGGGWYSKSSTLRSAKRYAGARASSWSTVGFRVVRELSEPEEDVQE